MLKSNSLILFQGDSITDAGRTYDVDDDSGLIVTDQKINEKLGFGYPQKIKTYFDEFCADKNYTVKNLAVSGSRSVDLLQRFDEDYCDIKPDYISMLVGVNDTWRRYDANSITKTETYADNYRVMLEKLSKKFDCGLILLEPFLIPTDAKKDEWREDLDPKIQVVRKVAREFNAAYIPLDGVFASNCVLNEPFLFSHDGVHLTDLGHSIVAKLWLDILLG